MSDDTPIIPQAIPPCHLIDDAYDALQGCRALIAMLHYAMLNDAIDLERQDLQTYSRLLWQQLSLAITMVAQIREEIAR